MQNRDNFLDNKRIGTKNERMENLIIIMIKYLMNELSLLFILHYIIVLVLKKLRLIGL